MIVVTVFLSILNQMEFNLVQNRKENCHHDHIPFNVKGNGILVFSVWGTLIGSPVVVTVHHKSDQTACMETKDKKYNLRQKVHSCGSLAAIIHFIMKGCKSP